MLSLEERVTHLENYLDALLNKMNIDKNYIDADIASNRTINSEQEIDISNNRTGIEEAYETTLTNTDDIADVRAALEEVYEMIVPEEE